MRGARRSLVTAWLRVVFLGPLLLPLVARAQTIREVVLPLPTPTGAFPVGTRVSYLTDVSRVDSAFPAGRPVTVQLWYPAARATGRSAPYLWERGLLSALLRNEYYGIDSAALETWSTLVTHSIVDAAPAKGKRPLLAFSVGLGVIRANYTSLAEDLASHGYIVAVVESPLQGLMVRPDGRTIVDTAGQYGEVVAHRRGVEAWSRDISFILDQFAAAPRTSPLRAIADVTDWSEIGALGHSSGGLVAIATCQRDRRVRACVDMDGGVSDPTQQPLADFVTSGISKPTLFLNSQPLYDDTTLARRGLTREQWVKRGEGSRIAFDSLIARSRAPVWIGHIAGTGHFSFSDGPFVMPSSISRFGGRIILPARGLNVVSTTLRAFFDRELCARGAGLASLAGRMPELTLTPPKT